MYAAAVSMLLAAGPLAFGQGGDFACCIVTFVLLALVACGAVAVYVLAQHYPHKKRTEGLRQVAEELQFDFTPEYDAGLLNDLAGRNFYLFSLENRGAVYNVLRGRTGGLEVTIFDYTYTLNPGVHTRGAEIDQTAVAFRFGGPPLPAFLLRPEGVWDKISHLFGYQDINFAEHRAFSSRYLLRGPNEAAIREVFTDEVLAFYEGLEGVCTEANGDRLLFYRHEKRVDPERIRPFLEESLKVMALFRPPGAEKAQPGAG